MHTSFWLNTEFRKFNALVDEVPENQTYFTNRKSTHRHIYLLNVIRQFWSTMYVHVAVTGCFEKVKRNFSLRWTSVFGNFEKLKAKDNQSYKHSPNFFTFSEFVIEMTGSSLACSISIGQFTDSMCLVELNSKPFLNGSMTVDSNHGNQEKNCTRTGMIFYCN